MSNPTTDTAPNRSVERPEHETDNSVDSPAEGTSTEPSASPADEATDNSVEKIDDDHRNDPPEDEPDTFPRAYVEKLRKENADARAKLKDRDALAERLHAALAAADGRLADPTDLPYSEDHLDPESMGTAIADLIARKPHLKARRFGGDVGQGSRGGVNGAQVDLLGTLRNLAG